MALVEDNEGVNGFRGFSRVQGQQVGLLTVFGRDRYNSLIDKYAIQFKEEYGIALVRDSGIIRYTMTDGEVRYAIQPTYLVYFGWLAQWNRDKREGDTVWMKTKALLK